MGLANAYIAILQDISKSIEAIQNGRGGMEPLKNAMTKRIEFLHPSHDDRRGPSFHDHKEAVISELKNLGWRVFIIWECKVPRQGEFAALAEEISIDE